MIAAAPAASTPSATKKRRSSDTAFAALRQRIREVVRQPPELVWAIGDERCQRAAVVVEVDGPELVEFVVELHASPFPEHGPRTGDAGRIDPTRRTAARAALGRPRGPSRQWRCPEPWRSFNARGGRAHLVAHGVRTATSPQAYMSSNAAWPPASARIPPAGRRSQPGRDVRLRADSHQHGVTRHRRSIVEAHAANPSLGHVDPAEGRLRPEVDPWSRQRFASNCAISSPSTRARVARDRRA